MASIYKKRKPKRSRSRYGRRNNRNHRRDVYNQISERERLEGRRSNSRDDRFSREREESEMKREREGRITIGNVIKAIAIIVILLLVCAGIACLGFSGIYTSQDAGLAQKLKIGFYIFGGASVVLVVIAAIIVKLFSKYRGKEYYEDFEDDDGNADEENDADAEGDEDEKAEGKGSSAPTEIGAQENEPDGNQPFWLDLSLGSQLEDEAKATEASLDVELQEALTQLNIDREDFKYCVDQMQAYLNEEAGLSERDMSTILRWHNDGIMPKLTGKVLAKAGWLEDGQGDAKESNEGSDADFIRQLLEEEEDEPGKASGTVSSGGNSYNFDLDGIDALGNHNGVLSLETSHDIFGDQSKNVVADIRVNVDPEQQAEEERLTEEARQREAHCQIIETEFDNLRQTLEVVNCFEFDDLSLDEKETLIDCWNEAILPNCNEGDWQSLAQMCAGDKDITARAILLLAKVLADPFFDYLVDDCRDILMGCRGRIKTKTEVGLREWVEKFDGDESALQTVIVPANQSTAPQPPKAAPDQAPEDKSSKQSERVIIPGLNDNTEKRYPDGFVTRVVSGGPSSHEAIFETHAPTKKGKGKKGDQGNSQNNGQKKGQGKTGK